MTERSRRLFFQQSQHLPQLLHLMLQQGIQALGRLGGCKTPRSLDSLVSQAQGQSLDLIIEDTQALNLRPQISVDSLSSVWCGHVQRAWCAGDIMRQGRPF